MTREWTPLLIVLVACLVALGGGVLVGDFVWDDQLLVLENTLTGSLSNLPGFFSVDLWATTPKMVGPTGYFRPLLLTDLALDRAFFGLSPMAHRAHSLLWHLVAVVLAFRLFRKLELSPMVAGTGVALFALHPAQVEAVSFVSARNDPMAAVFLLVALLLLARPSLRPGHLAGAAVAVLAGALSKETALLAPLVYAAVEWARTGRPGSMRGHLAIGAGVVLALAIRFWSGVPWPPGVGMSEIADTLVPAISWQASDLLLAGPLLPGRHLGWTPAAPVHLAAGAVIVGILVGLIGRRRASAGLALALLTWLPAVVAVARLGGLPSRYLYLPLLGLGLALAAALARLPRLLPWTFVLLVAGLGYSSLTIVGSWSSDRDLWVAAHRLHHTPYTAGIAAKVHEDLGLLPDAAALYSEATEAPRPFVESCYNVAAIHFKLNDPAAAGVAGLQALDNGCPASPELLAPTALGLAIAGRWDEAEELALQVGSDPTGKAILVRVGAAARRADLGPLMAASDDPDERRALARQVAFVLESAGDVEVAAKLRGPRPDAAGGGGLR